MKAILKHIVLFLLLGSMQQAIAQCGLTANAENKNLSITITTDCTINGYIILKNTDLTIEPGGSLTITRYVINNNGASDPVIVNGGTFIVGSDSVAGEDYFNNTSSGIVTVQNGGTMVVVGDYTNGQNANTNFLDGTINIGGDFLNSGNGDISADGDVSVGGDFTNSGNNSTMNVAGTLDVEGDLVSTSNDPINVESGGVVVAQSVDTSGDINVADGGTIYGEDGVTSTGTINVDSNNEDTDCTNNCCGAACNTAGTQIDPEVLPITLVSFDASQESNSVLLQWKTVAEINFSHFELYRIDNSDKTLLGTINSTGNQQGDEYEFIDSNPKLGLNYYQLKSVDVDEYTEWFAPISIVFKPIHINFELYPNPSTAVNLKTDIYEDFTIEVFNLAGARVMKSKVSNKDLSAIQSLKPGSYVFRYSLGGYQISQHIILQ